MRLGGEQILKRILPNPIVMNSKGKDIEEYGFQPLYYKGGKKIPS